jgi:hypothetical protein
MIARWKEDAILLAGQFALLQKAFPSVEYLPYARRNGAFNDGCTFCEFKKWCAVGFDAGMVSGLVEYERWEPWAVGQGQDGPVPAGELPY